MIFYDGKLWCDENIQSSWKFTYASHWKLIVQFISSVQRIYINFFIFSSSFLLFYHLFLFYIYSISNFQYRSTSNYKIRTKSILSLPTATLRGNMVRKLIKTIYRFDFGLHSFFAHRFIYKLFNFHDLCIWVCST